MGKKDATAACCAASGGISACTVPLRTGSTRDYFASHDGRRRTTGRAKKLAKRGEARRGETRRGEARHVESRAARRRAYCVDAQWNAPEQLMEATHPPGHFGTNPKAAGP